MPTVNPLNDKGFSFVSYGGLNNAALQRPWLDFSVIAQALQSETLLTRSAMPPAWTKKQCGEQLSTYRRREFSSDFIHVAFPFGRDAVGQNGRIHVDVLGRYS
jgi:hypothetical protein